MLPVYDLQNAEGRTEFDACLRRLRATVSLTGDTASTVAAVLEAVQTEGNLAVERYMRQWTDPQYSWSEMRVTEAELAGAASRVDDVLLGAIDRAIEQVRAYQRHVLPNEVAPVEIGGAQLGMKWSPVDSAGLLVPGGTAVLFSTLIMLAVPAIEAGVAPSQITVAHPPPTRRGDEAVGDISPIVLATAHRLGIEKVYRIGGAQAVAALAYGTESVDPVDLIAGPGNVYVQLAKAMVNGYVGTDNGFYGPSEIVVVAEDTADPARVAADLIAQAEHDPGKCFLVTWSEPLLAAVLDQIETQFVDRHRQDAIAAALRDESCAALVADADQAADVANRIACEHVNLAVADPQAWLARLRHAGEVFLGDDAPVAAGDYYAGPSHCLPTGTTARFASGVSVYTFLKRTGTVAYPAGMPEQAVLDVARMAEAEGLDGHAASARVRGG